MKVDKNLTTIAVGSVTGQLKIISMKGKILGQMNLNLPLPFTWEILGSNVDQRVL